MDQLLYLRRQHGDVYVTQLPSGQDIPWKPLSVAEYLKYSSLFQTGQHPIAFIEDEIFCKCVLDKVLVDKIGNLKAGIVTTVSATIMAYSGPNSTEELNLVLDYNRTKAGEALNDLVMFICTAFPAYKPEDVEAMSYSDMMFRAAQAESKMLKSGFLTEPLNFSEIVPEQQADQGERLQENKQMINKFYEQQGMQIPDSIKKAGREKIISHPRPPSVPDKTQEQTIIKRSDMIEHMGVMDGHDKETAIHQKSTDKTAQFYSEYFKQIQDGELKIKTPEERKVAAEARMEQNRLKNLETHRQTVAAAKAELPKLLKVREDARKRKAKQAARRRR